MSSTSRDRHGENSLLHSTEKAWDCPTSALHRAGTLLAIHSSYMTRIKKHVAVKANRKQSNYACSLLRPKTDLHYVELIEEKVIMNLAMRNCVRAAVHFERKMSTAKAFRKNHHLILRSPHRDFAVCCVPYVLTGHGIINKMVVLQVSENHAVTR